MKEKVLELKIVEINEEWSVWYITHQNEEVLPRGIFEDDELGVYSTLSPLFMIEEKEEPVLGPLGRWEASDNEPNKILNVDVPLLQKKVDRLNEKHGIERFEIERCMKGEGYYVINSDFSASWVIEGEALINELRYVSLNYFKSRKEAEWCASKMKDYLLKLRKEWREENGAK